MACANAVSSTEPETRGSPASRGYTLLELLVTLILAGILFGLGAPALSEWRRGSLIDSTAQLLVTHLQAARNHSVTSSVDVMICPRGRDCGDPDWRDGWKVFVDRDGNRRLDPDEDVLLEHALAESVTLSWRRHPSWLFYRHTGIGWPNGTFRLCSRDTGRTAAAVVVSGSGRPRLDDGDRQPPCAS